MEVATTRLAITPPADVLPVARARSVPAAPVDRSAASDAVDTVEFSQNAENRQPSPTIEVLQQRRLANTPSGVRLQVNETVDRVIAEIVNENNEVIKQIPPEEAVRLFARFREVTGLIFDLEI